MLGCDLLGHGASNPNLCLGTQVGSPDSPRSESQVQLLTATYTNKRAHPLLVGSGGNCPVLHTQEAWAPVDPVGWLPRDLAHKPGPWEAGAQTHSRRNCGGRRGGPGSPGPGQRLEMPQGHWGTHRWLLPPLGRSPSVPPPRRWEG